MSQLFAIFGIDWRLLLVNLVNFAVLLCGLWYLLYKPITAMLERRQKDIAKGVEDAKAARHELEKIEASRSEMLAKAGSEADALLEHARAAADATGKEVLTEAKRAAAALVLAAEVQGKEIKNQALQESKEEIAKLIVLGMEKLSR